MLSIAREFAPQETYKAMRLLVSLSVRYLIVGGGRSGTVEQALADAACDVSDRKIVTAKDLLSKLDPVTPKDREFREGFAVAQVANAKFARYLLRSLEMTVKAEPNPCFIPNDDAHVINLEHVLPRKPEGKWPQFTDDEADAFHRRLGNVALLQAKSNSDLRNSTFDDKRGVYAASQIAGVDAWTVEQIMNRQEKMADFAPATWPLAVE
jgi:hypothetical protein